jgi:hypothetical protein
MMSDFDFNMDEFNTLLETANETLSCDAACQEEKKRQELEQSYLDAESNIVSGPEKFYTAKKDYITFTKGEAGYNEYITNELEKESTAIVTTYQDKFNETIKMIKNLFNTYNGLSINYNNVYDLYGKYKQENDDIEKKFKTTVSDTITNDRKTYYEDQVLNRLHNYYYFFMFVYIFIVVVFFVASFLVESDFIFRTRMLIFILLVAYPFICYFVYQLAEKIINYINSFLPKNVYKTL